MFDPSYLLALTGGLLGPKLSGAVGLFLGLLHLSASLSDQCVCPRGRFTVRRLRVRPSLRERKGKREILRRKKKKVAKRFVARDRAPDEKSKRGKWWSRRGGEQVWLCVSKRYRVTLLVPVVGPGRGRPQRSWRWPPPPAFAPASAPWSPWSWPEGPRSRALEDRIGPRTPRRG